MMKRKEWQDYKKKNGIETGLGGKVSLGDALDKYEKSKKTAADFKKLEDVAKDYIKAARAAKSKAAAFVESKLNSEMARLDEEQRNAQAEAAKNQPNPQAKQAKALLTKASKIHANLGGIYKTLSGKQDVYEAEPDSDLYREREQLRRALEKEIDDLREFAVGHMYFHDAYNKLNRLALFGDDYKPFLKSFKSGAEELKKGMKDFADEMGV